MKLAIISLKSKTSELIAKEATKYFSQVDFLNLKEIEVNVSTNKQEVFHQGEPLEKYDCIYCRGSYKYALLLRSITQTLNKETYMPLSPESFTVGHDKFLTLVALLNNKICIPKTYLAPNPKSAKKIIEQVHFPAIIKTQSGTHGKGVMVADSLESAKTILDALEIFKQPYTIQEYIDTNATDVRVLVLGDKVLGSMKRKAAKQDIRANIHAGGKGLPYIIDYDTAKMCIKASKAVGAEICAIDILEGKENYVIEANISPGLQGISETTKENLYKQVAEYLYKRTKEFKDSKDSKQYKDVLSNLNIEKDGQKEILTNLDIKLGKIRIPEVVNKIAKFDEDEEIIIVATKGCIKIKKTDVK
ncbi:RimK family alpha-L-glutamate ligase [archaeon]|nr:RimK family alpha-L-glutamate ligase [archaeon]